MIIVESLNSWLINFKLDSIEVTPHLNQLCQENNSILALHIQPQVKSGRSSDAHFMYNTGLLPINNGAVAVRFGEAEYPSLAKALKGINHYLWFVMMLNIGIKKQLSNLMDLHNYMIVVR